MRIKLTYATALLAAGTAASAIVAAPTAAAVPKTCFVNGAGPMCKSPGTVEVTSDAPAVNFYPHGTMPYLVGGQ